MNILDIIWPWGALRRERQCFARKVSAYEAEIASYGEAVRASRTEQDDLRLRLASADLRRKNGEAEIRRLHSVIDTGHFRNPKTGRLGRKGETF